MKIEIPKQLRNKNFRFCPLNKGSKKSYSNHNKFNCSFDDKNLLEHLKLNGNYGVLCGYNNLLVVDIDNQKIQTEIANLHLPKTFTVRSALNKTPHLYFKTENPKPTLRGDGIDLIGKGCYVVGTSCIIEKNKQLYTYRLSIDFPVAFLTDNNYNKVLEILNKYKRSNKHNNLNFVKKPKPKESHFLNRSEFINKELDLIIEDIIYTNGRYCFIVSSTDGKYINKSFDFNKLQHWVFLRKLNLVGNIITIKAEEYVDKRTGQKQLRWIPLNVKKE